MKLLKNSNPFFYKGENMTEPQLGVYSWKEKAKKTEPWKGICCKACWNAHGKRCTCKCGGANHGKGHARSPPQKGVKKYKPKYKIRKKRGDEVCQE